MTQTTGLKVTGLPGAMFTPAGGDVVGTMAVTLGDDTMSASGIVEQADANGVTHPIVRGIMFAIPRSLVESENTP